MKRKWQLKLIKFGKKISDLYKYVSYYKLVWGMGIIVIVAFAYADRQIALCQISPLTELIANPIVFVWTIGVIGIIFLLLSLLSITPFTLIDYFILTIPVCFLIYTIMAYFRGGFIGLKLSYLILTIFGFSILFFFRWIIAKIKSYYLRILKSLYRDSSPADIFKTDVPIQGISEDELDRKDFSQAIAKAVIGYKDANSLVIGLTGEWGSGKSSIINMSVEYIRNHYKDSCIKPCIIEFNPWNFSNQNQLIKQFFKTLSDAIRSLNTYLGSKDISEKLDVYSVLIEQVLISTTFTTPSLDFSKLIKNLGGLITSTQVNNLSQTRKQLEKSLYEYSRKLIVIIDDIDRLTNSEMRQIFQLVKSIANFPNTMYILSFDKKIVINGLCSEQGGGKQIDGEKYLEKIIQVDLSIPTIKFEKVYSKLDDNLKMIFNNCTFTPMRWTNIWYDGFKDFFSSIRDVNRYMNVLRFQFGLTKNQVNIIDLSAIIAIKIFDYTAYCTIRDNKNLLTGIIAENSKQRKEDEKEIHDLLDDVIKQSKYKKLLPLLQRLFPKLENIYGNNIFGVAIGSVSEWFTENRICHPERFQLYFQLDISSNDISPSEIKNILDAVHDEFLFKTYINNLIENGKILRFLEILENYTPSEDKIPASAINNILTILLDEGDKFPDNDSSNLISTELKIGRITYQLCKKIPEQAARGQLFLTIADKINNSLYPLIYDIYLYDQEHGRYKLKKDPEQEGNRMISSKDLDLLEQKGLSKIRTWSSNKKLEEHKKLGIILHIWKTWANVWGNKTEVQQYIEDKIKNSDFLIKFIGSYISISRTQIGSNYGYTETAYYNLDEFKKFLNGNIDVICKQVDKINRATLNGDQIKILNMFKDALNGKNLSPRRNFSQEL